MFVLFCHGRSLHPMFSEWQFCSYVDLVCMKLSNLIWFYIFGVKFLFGRLFLFWPGTIVAVRLKMVSHTSCYRVQVFFYVLRFYLDCGEYCALGLDFVFVLFFFDCCFFCFLEEMWLLYFFFYFTWSLLCARIFCFYLYGFLGVMLLLGVLCAQESLQTDTK